MKKQIGGAVLGSLFAVLPVFALGGDSATIAQLQAENAAITAGNLSVNPQASLQAITPVGQGGGNRILRIAGRPGGQCADPAACE